MILEEKGVFLTASYRIEASVDSGEQLSQAQQELLGLLRDDQKSSGGFSPEKISRIFALAGSCRVKRKGSLAQRECYLVSHIDCFPVQRDGGVEIHYEPHGVPGQVRERISQPGRQVAGTWMMYREDTKKVYVFFRDDLGKVWNKCRTERVSFRQLQEMIQALTRRQTYDRARFARALCALDTPVFQIRPGVRRRDGDTELLFYGIPLSGARERLEIPYQKYVSWLMKNGREEELCPGSICYSNRSGNLAWIQKLYQLSGKSGKDRFRNGEWDRIAGTEGMLSEYGIYEEQGWPCEVLIEKELFQRISLMEDRKSRGAYLVITDQGRTELWKRSFPDFQVYDQASLKEEMEITDLRKSYFIIWDGDRIEEEGEGLLFYLFRFLSVAGLTIFLYPRDMIDLCKQEKLANMTGRMDLAALTAEAAAGMERAAREKKDVFEFVIQNRRGSKKRLIHYLTETGARVGILVGQGSEMAAETEFLNQHYRDRWAAVSDSHGNGEKKSIYLTDLPGIYDVEVNHYIVSKGHFSVEQKRAVICESQCRGLRSIVCIYQID